jgi:hypothetical protein
MKHPPPRALVVDGPHGALSSALHRGHVHDLDFARDLVEALDRIDSAVPPYDLIFCDLTSGEVPGPELWALLSIRRKVAASRVVFVATAPVNPSLRDFLARVPNVCVELPVAAGAATRRPRGAASGRPGRALTGHSRGARRAGRSGHFGSA